MSSLVEVKNQITQRCRMSGRDPSAVQVLAVSKLQPEEKIRSLANEGQKEFAENYVQELLTKQEALQDLKLSWHLIGHLQRNKVKMVVGRVALIHSVDSLDLAIEIDKRAEAAGLCQNILLEANVGGESSKSGFDPEKLKSVFEELLDLKNISVQGLMTMPPFVENPEDNRKYFVRLRELRDELEDIGGLFLPELSMGTSQDYLVAIEEGATWVRIGTSLFGTREK